MTKKMQFYIIHYNTVIFIACVIICLFSSTLSAWNVVAIQVTVLKYITSAAALEEYKHGIPTLGIDPPSPASHAFLPGTKSSNPPTVTRNSEPLIYLFPVTKRQANKPWITSQNHQHHEEHNKDLFIQNQHADVDSDHMGAGDEDHVSETFQ